MRSLQVIYVENGDDAGYSDLQVMSSDAGWYIGTIYQNPGQSFQEPGSRDTGYFPTKEIAEKVLAAMEEYYKEVESKDVQGNLDTFASDLDAVIWQTLGYIDNVGYRLYP